MSDVVKSPSSERLIDWGFLRLIPVKVLDLGGDNFLAAVSEVNLNASGDTEDEAVENLKDIVLSIYRLYRRTPASRLGLEATRQLAFLNGNDRHTDKRRRVSKQYECRAVVTKEADGGFSAVANQLPGIASQGDTESEVINNLGKAFAAAIEAYLASGERLPWVYSYDEFPKEVCFMVAIE